MIGFRESVGLYFKNYVKFQGRSRRSEYWWPALFNMLVVLCLGGLGYVLGGGAEAVQNETLGPLGLVLFGVLILYGLAIIIPSIAVTVRRFHDINVSGWFYLLFVVIGFIPLLGLLASLAQLIMTVLPGKQGPNKFGEDPKGTSVDSVFS